MNIIPLIGLSLVYIMIEIVVALHSFLHLILINFSDRINRIRFISLTALKYSSAITHYFKLLLLLILIFIHILVMVYSYFYSLVLLSSQS